MENRLCLNEKPSHIKCEGLITWQFNPYSNKRTREECIEWKGQPDIRFRKQGKPFKPLLDNELKNTEIWIYSSNKDIIEFIRKYDWNSKINSTSGSCANFPAYKIHEVIKEEFYGK